MEIKELLIVVIAVWVAFKLPEWSKKLIPDGIDKFEIPEVAKVVGQFFIAYLFSRIGWGPLASSLNSAMGSFKELAKAEQITAVVNVPEGIIAAFSIVATLWLLSAVFTALPDCKKGKDTMIAVGILIFVFSFNNLVWDGVKDYFISNLNGAEALMETEPFKIIEGSFSSPAP